MSQDLETFEESQKSTFDDKKVIINITFTGTDCNSSVTTDESNTLDPETEFLVEPTLRDSKVVDSIFSFLEERTYNDCKCILACFGCIMILVMMAIVLPNQVFNRPINRSCILPDGRCIDYGHSADINTFDCFYKRGTIDVSPCEPEIKEPESFGFPSRSCILSDGTCMDLETERESNLCTELGSKLVLASCKSISKCSSCTYRESRCDKDFCGRRLICGETISKQECKELNGVFNTVSCPVK